MSDQTDNLSNLVKPYGLSEEESRLYIFLLQHGFTSALDISRQLHLGRTKIYRLLDVLKRKQLVEFQVQERGMKFGATHPSKFQHLVTEQEQMVASLRQNVPQLISQLTSLLPATERASQVLYFEGAEGLKQVSYNITKAQGLVRVLEMEHLSDFVPVDFAEAVRHELVEQQIYVRDLTNKKSFPGYTDVSELITTYAESRYIAPEKLKINFEVLIYNDVYATYSYKNEHIFCVEIHNAQLAEMQKQIFDFIWQEAQPMKFIDERGAAVVE